MPANTAADILESPSAMGIQINTQEVTISEPAVSHQPHEVTTDLADMPGINRTRYGREIKQPNRYVALQVATFGRNNEKWTEVMEKELAEFDRLEVRS